MNYLAKCAPRNTAAINIVKGGALTYACSENVTQPVPRVCTDYSTSIYFYIQQTQGRRVLHAITVLKKGHGSYGWPHACCFPSWFLAPPRDHGPTTSSSAGPSTKLLIFLLILGHVGERVCTCIVCTYSASTTPLHVGTYIHIYVHARL